MAGKIQTGRHMEASDFSRNFSEETAKLITFRQFMIEGADHNFERTEDELVHRVAGWLRRHAPGSVVKTSLDP
ncbi:MAG: hypothetical protein HQL48_03085 [Gammaproteobacteria bacterium]|nr:hypothetical protein [Gammaproteobacteria bacterium]